jgi:hypothetical protein
LILENFKIKEQGTWSELKVKQGDIEKVITNEKQNRTADTEQALPPSQISRATRSAPTSKSDDTRSSGDSALYGKMMMAPQ